MADETFKPIGTLMPNWMINSVDRIMDFYIGKYLNCDPVILDRPPSPATSTFSTPIFRSARRSAATVPSTVFSLRNTRRANTS